MRAWEMRETFTTKKWEVGWDGGWRGGGYSMWVEVTSRHPGTIRNYEKHWTTGEQLKVSQLT